MNIRQVASPGTFILHNKMKVNNRASPPPLKWAGQLGYNGEEKKTALIGVQREITQIIKQCACTVVLQEMNHRSTHQHFVFRFRLLTRQQPSDYIIAVHQ